MSLLDQPLCSFSSTATPLEPLLVVEWRGEEAISRPYRFEIKLATINPLLDDEAMLGQPATLKLTDAKGNAQPYHGIVTEAELLDGDGQYFYFRVILEPRMAILRQSRFSEIWLDKNLPDLIRAVVSEAGLQSEGPGTSGAQADTYDFDIRLAADDLALQESSFTCQFEESSFAFLSRLLEYYGVYYFFEQQGDHEAIVFCGDQRYQPQDETLLNYRPLDTELDAGSGIALTRTFNRRLASQPKQVVLQDFSATNAQLQLLDSASIATASLAVNADSEQSQAADSAPAFNGEQWLYGEHFGTNQEGQTLAKLRAEALGCRHREFHGNGRAVGLRAGYPMRLIGHLRLTLNTRYLIIQVQHDGSQPLPGLGQDQAGTSGDTSTRFIAIPGDVQFRPQRLTRKPRVQGLLSAIVDGDDAGQPLLNQNGCYKVIFPFIRSDKPQTRGSAWVRMATMSSGASHGMHFPLLKGTEVLVSFIGGDPDRPVITGSVPNSENPNKVNEKNATQSGLSTSGGHYLAMEDSPNGPLMQMGAPVGSTIFSLGQGEISGAQLQTQNHMQFSSTSFLHQIPGLYTKQIGLGATPDGQSPTTTDSSEKPAGSTVPPEKKETPPSSPPEYDPATDSVYKEKSEAEESAKKTKEAADKAYESNPTSENLAAKQAADKTYAKQKSDLDDYKAQQQQLADAKSKQAAAQAAYDNDPSEGNFNKLKASQKKYKDQQISFSAYQKEQSLKQERDKSAENMAKAKAASEAAPNDPEKTKAYKDAEKDYNQKNNEYEEFQEEHKKKEEEKKEKEEKEAEKPKYPHTKELNEWWGKGGASAPLISAEATASALMVEQNLAGEQWEGSAGVIKQYVEAFAQYTDINASVIGIDWKIGPHYEFKTFGNEHITPVHKWIAEVAVHNLGVQETESVQSVFKTGVFKVEAATMIELAVGVHSIVIQDTGITINSPMQVQFVGAGGLFANSLLTSGNVNAGGTLAANNLMTMSLNAGKGTLGELTVTQALLGSGIFDPAPLIAQLADAMAAMEALKAANSAILVANDAASDAMGASAEAAALALGYTPID